jgi:hypothetical protein
LLLCSDGLYSMVPDEQIKENLESTPDPQEACVNLVNLANDAGGLDNITVVILDFDDGEGVEVLAPSAGVEQADEGLTRQMRVPTFEPAPGSAGGGSQAPPAPAPPAGTRPDQGGFTATVSAPPRRTDDTIIATAPEAPSAQPDRFDVRQRGPRRRRTRRIAIWVVAFVAVLALAGVGLRLYLDSRWFVGTKDGHVAVFRGIPTDLFGTVNLFSLVREFDGIPARQAERLVAYRDLSDGHTASSENDALRIVQTIRKQLADQRRSGAPSP